jgi:hypothetical protein
VDQACAPVRVRHDASLPASARRTMRHEGHTRTCWPRLVALCSTSKMYSPLIDTRLVPTVVINTTVRPSSVKDAYTHTLAHSQGKFAQTCRRTLPRALRLSRKRCASAASSSPKVFAIRTCSFPSDSHLWLRGKEEGGREREGKQTEIGVAKSAKKKEE